MSLLRKLEVQISYVVKQKEKDTHSGILFFLAAALGFEPRECWSQSPVPYHLAKPQYVALSVERLWLG